MTPPNLVLTLLENLWRYGLALWFLPALIADDIGTRVFLGILCGAWYFVGMRVCFYDLLQRLRWYWAVIATLIIQFSPILWIGWLILGPLGDTRRRKRRREEYRQTHRTFDEQEHLLWMERQGYQRPKDALHLHKDLLAGKSRAALEAHLERELALDRSPVRSASPISYTEKFTPEESIYHNEAALPAWDEVEAHEAKRRKAPTYDPPVIEGWRSIEVERLYRRGRFDEVVALLRREHAEAELRPDSQTREAIEAWLRIARTRQLERELIKFRAEFDLRTSDPSLP